uniref:Protein DBF4 homolog A n=1 Tax=Phallusia mammillata TaxID=59560 RepID=A0A6F9DBB0_9ASCI|nr:protein DBF4 homolog A [Phallusia mammillata]
MAEEAKSSRLPLAGKRFFIDPKVEKGMANKLKQNLLLLGGVVEDFLDGNINFALTNEENLLPPQKSEQPSPSNMCSPFNTSVPSPHIAEHKPSSSVRWKKIANKAKSKRASSTSLIETARKLGIKIRYVKEVWEWLSKTKEKLVKTDINHPTRPTAIVLREPCIKIEDLKHKPIYEEMESVTYLDFEGLKNRCPFVNPSASPASKKSQKKKEDNQKGFCECCQCSYLNESKHCRSVEHKSYGELRSNYQRLDQYVSNNDLHLKSFLKRASLAVQEKSLPQNNMQVTKKSPIKAAVRFKQPNQSLGICSTPTLNNANILRTRRRSLSPQKPSFGQKQKLSRTRTSVSPRRLTGETSTVTTPAINTRRTSPRKFPRKELQHSKTSNEASATSVRHKLPKTFQQNSPKSNPNAIRSPSPVLSPRTKRRSLNRKLDIDSPTESVSPQLTVSARISRSASKLKDNTLHAMITRKRSISRDSFDPLPNSSTSDT